MSIIPLNSYKTSHGYAHKERRVASKAPSDASTKDG